MVFKEGNVMNSLASFDGARIAYHDEGAGEAAILLHGFGASDKPRSEGAYADSAMARDVAALIDRLVPPAVDVVGFSMGSLTTAKLLALGVPQLRSAIARPPPDSDQSRRAHPDRWDEPGILVWEVCWSRTASRTRSRRTDSWMRSILEPAAQEAAQTLP
jgi:pimeloyl-ACP methyl ester carboxylesterase